jgi:gliding motility-associated-like protein
VPKGCNLNQLPFTNLSKRVSANANYYWDFGDGSTSSSANPTHTYTNTGTYIVRLKLVDSSSCNISDSTQQTITIQQAQSTVLPDATICSSDSVQIGIPPSSDPNAKYNWLPNYALSDAAIANPFSSADVTTLYALFYTHDYCTDTVAQLVKVPFDSLEITGGKVFCPKDTLRLLVKNANTSNTITYAWTPTSQILSGANTANPLCAPVRDTLFRVTGVDANGCVYSDSFYVKVASTLGNLSIVAIPDTILFGDTSQIQTIYSAEVVKFQWENDPTLTAVDIPNPKAAPLFTKSYQLTAFDTNGCKLVSDIRIVVLRTPCNKEGVYIPNAFSPNNDGKNDVWYVRGNDVKSITIAVFDRWGQKVFESSDINKGWDGTFKGAKLDPSVFGFYIEGLCLNNERFSLKGNVTILR